MTEQAELLSLSIGEILKNARAARGQSVRDISRRMKLPGSIIESIERDRLDELAPIYRRGYVLNYARELGVDAAPLVAELDRRDNQPPELREVLPPAGNFYRFERYLRLATYVFTTTLIVTPLVWFFINTGADFFEGYNPDIKTAVAEGEPGEFARASRKEVLVQLLRNDPPDGADEAEATHFRADLMPPPWRSLLNPEISDPEEIVGSGIGPLLERERKKLAFPFIQTPFAAGGDPADSDLVLSLRNESWVEITDASGRRLEFNLLRGGRHAYRGAAPFHIMLGMATHVTITVDGVPVDFSPHRQAQVARFDLLADGSTFRN